MKKLLFVAVIFFIAYSNSKADYCFVQLFSTENKNRAESFFNRFKEPPATFLLKYGNYYTIRIGPFEDKETCRVKAKIMKRKFRKFKIKPITINRSQKFFPENNTVKEYFFNLQKEKPQKEEKKRQREEKYLLYLKKAQICMGKKDCTNAIRYLTLAIKERPNNPTLYVYLGYAYAHIGNYTKAIDSFKKSLEIDPNFAEGYEGLGYLYLKLNASKVAEIMFKKAYEINPKDVTYAVNYAVALTRNGKYKEAKELFSKLKEKYPFIPELFFNDALVNLKLKNYKEALKDLEIFLEMTKENDYYQTYRETAEKLIEVIKRWKSSKKVLH